MLIIIERVGNHSGILSLTSIIIGIVIFFAQQHREKKLKQEEIK
jgi:hypothetical protein